MILKTWKITLALPLAFALAACGDDDGGNNNTGLCGNGVIEGAEQCDMDQHGTTTCANIGGFTGGTLACSGACTFDTSGCTNVNPDCGNGVIDDEEACDATNLNGQECADVGNYTGGTLACSTSCTFDTTGCTAAPACGNGIIEGSEVCDGTNLNGQECEDVGNFDGGTLACSGTCTWNTAQCTAPITCGNSALDTGEDCDGLLLNDTECGDLEGFLEGGTLTCQTNCTFNTDQCIPDPSAQIGIARAAADGVVDIDLSGVWVTYLKQNVGSSDPAGFFVQVDPTGPALFIAVDPTTQNPVPQVGDEVAFTITAMDTAGSLRMATAITGYSRLSQGHDVSTLTQNVSTAADLVTALNNFESELITVTGTLTSAFADAGNNHVAADMTTAGVTTAGLKLRIPTTLRPALGMDIGCTFTVTQTPMWRYTTTAQVSAYLLSEVTVHTCPAPFVVSATAIDATEIVVTFNRAIDPASVHSNGDQFTFDNGLNASAALASGSTVHVSTSHQNAGTQYTVIVTNTVLDVLGTGVGTPNTAQFLGFGVTTEILCSDGLDDDGDGYVDCLDSDCSADLACAWGQQLYLWEVDADQPSTDATEFVEVINLTGAAVDFSTQKYFLVLVNGSGEAVYGAVQLTGTLADGAVHLTGQATVPGVVENFPTTVQNGQDGILLVRCDTCTDVDTDFTSGVTLGATATFTTAGGQTATKIDGLAYGTTADADLLTALGVTAMFSEGQPSRSLHRMSPTVWSTAAPSPGVSDMQ